MYTHSHSQRRSLAGPYSIPGDTWYGGVALSFDNSTAYVPAGKGVYAFSASSLAYWSTTPLLATAANTAGGLALYRGIVQSIAT